MPTFRSPPVGAKGNSPFARSILMAFISLYLLISYIIYAKEKRMRLRIRFLSV